MLIVRRIFGPLASEEEMKGEKCRFSPRYAFVWGCRHMCLFGGVDKCVCGWIDI